MFLMYKKLNKVRKRRVPAKEKCLYKKYYTSYSKASYEH